GPSAWSPHRLVALVCARILPLSELKDLVGRSVMNLGFSHITVKCRHMCWSMVGILIVLATVDARAESALGFFTTFNGSFLSAEGGGGGALHANRPAQGPWERFTLLWELAPHFSVIPLQSGGTVCIQTVNGKFVTAEGGGGRETNANRSECGPWETFTIFMLGETPAGLFPIAGPIPTTGTVPVALRASNGDWVTAEG